MLVRSILTRKQTDIRALTSSSGDRIIHADPRAGLVAEVSRQKFKMLLNLADDMSRGKDEIMATGSPQFPPCVENHAARKR